MEINLGPNGEIDDRFVIRYTRNSYVQSLLGEDIWGKVSAEIKKTCKANRSWARLGNFGTGHCTQRA